MSSKRRTWWNFVISSLINLNDGLLKKKKKTYAGSNVDFGRGRDCFITLLARSIRGRYFLKKCFINLLYHFVIFYTVISFTYVKGFLILEILSHGPFLSAKSFLWLFCHHCSNHSIVIPSEMIEDFLHMALHFFTNFNKQTLVEWNVWWQDKIVLPRDRSDDHRFIIFFLLRHVAVIK